MAVTYKASRTLTIYRKIQCEACDNVFDYKVTEVFQSERTSTSWLTAGTAKKQVEEEVRNAHGQRVNQLSINGNNAVVEAKPCPNCGYYQSYMKAAKQSKGGFFTAGAILALLFALIWAVQVGKDIFFYGAVGLGVISLIYGVFLLATPLNRKWLKEHGKTKRDIPPSRMPLETKILG